MTGLREHFAETAEAAKHYDVTEAVLRQARRRRRLGRSVAAGAAALVATTAAAVLADRPAPGPVLDTVDATRPATPGRLDWLPARFVAPGPGAVPLLPIGTGVGAGALVYRRLTEVILLASDGASYRVPGEIRGLSPDGRWLAYSVGDELVLHSLADGQIRTVADSDVTGWSLDSTQVVLTLRRPDGRTPTAATVLRPDEGDNRTVPVPDPDWWAPRGLTADGQLVLLPRRLFPDPASDFLSTGSPLPGTPPPGAATESPAPPAATLTVPSSALGFGIGFVGPAEGTARSVTVLADRAAGMDDPEEWHGGVDKSIFVRGDTGGLVFQPLQRYQAADGNDSYGFGDLVEVDPATGRPVRQFRLPPATAETAGPHMVAIGPDGILLADDSGDRPTTLEVLDPVTGDRRAVAELGPDLRLDLVRGGTYFWP
ncbi:hypothetical protein [Asanoa sp. NPDC050611]|uniref:hypothetical protein n=1 Tax=Asanoa sp. NPDC050611 TaxID=3157098 RepID=UPI0033FCB461